MRTKVKAGTKKVSDSDRIYPVEEILEEREKPDGTMEYLIKWDGYPETNWEEESNVLSPELIEEFHKRQDRAKRRKTAKRTLNRTAPARPSAAAKGGRPNKKTSDIAESSNEESVPSKKHRRSGRLRTSESELSDMPVQSATTQQQLKSPSIHSRESSPEIKPRVRPLIVGSAACGAGSPQQRMLTPDSHPPSREPSAEPRLGRSSRMSHSPAMSPMTQQQLQTSSTHSPSREPSTQSNPLDRSRKSDRTMQPNGTPTRQRVQQEREQLQTPVNRPPWREPSTQSNVSTNNATAIGDIRKEDRDQSDDNVVDLVYPTDNYRALELSCKTNLLKLNEPVILVRKNFGCLPVEVYMNVISGSTEEILAVIVKCNDGVRSNLWKADAKIDITLLSGPPINTMSHSFRWGRSSCDIGLPVTLAEVLQEESPYIDRRGVLTIEVKIHLEKVDGYMQPFCRTFFSHPHPHLTNSTIIVKGKMFHVDSFLLSKSSPVFYEAFHGQHKDRKTSSLIVSDCTPEAFEVLLTKMYFPTDRVKPSNLINLLRLAYRFDVGFIIENCLEFLKGKTMPLDVKFAAIELSDKLGDAELQNFCVETIFKEELFDLLVKSKMYDDLSTEYKVLLLSKATKEQAEKVIELD